METTKEPMKEKTKKTLKKQILATVLLLLGNIVLFLTLWILRHYDKVYLDQILFQLKSASSGVNGDLAGSAVVFVGSLTILAMAVEILLYCFLSGNFKDKLRSNCQYLAYCATNMCAFFKKKSVTLGAVALALGIFVFMDQFNVLAYVGTTTTKSDFIEEHYVDPGETTLTFPEEKRNLIYIFLESMENTLADTSADGPITDNFIPELTLLAEENINFSNTSGLGGALSYSGTNWTAAAMVTQTSGVPVKVPITADSYGAEDVFIPGVTSIGEILQAQGYNQMLLVGSDAKFHGRESYFAQHGNYEILDTESLKAAGRLEPDYQEWWGFEDEKLFAYAKEELTRLAAEGEPFNFTMLTADTHFPDGYACSLCENTYENPYANVYACSAKQVSEFITWIQAQPFYENTTIVISGDHLTMDSDFLDEIDPNYVRTIYNCILNAPVAPKQEKNRQFAAFDMFPTTLAAMGVEIEGDRLGLGTNLFSAEQTLTEQYGFETLDNELLKRSEFYNTEFLKMEE